MTTEPIAWMVENNEDISFIMNHKGFVKPDGSWKSVTPVYVHPASDVALVEKLQKERDLLFQAHSHEMVRADKLQIECDRLYRIIELNGAVE